MKGIVLLVVAGAVLAGHVSFPSPALAQGVRLPLAGDSSVVFALSGSLRVRGESWSGFAATPGPANEDAFGLARALLKAELRAGDWLVVGAELKSSHAARRSLPGGIRTADKDWHEVQQLFVGVATAIPGGRLAARVGRYDLALGRERLVGPLDWANTRRTFQGASLRASGRVGEAMLFTARPVTVRRRTPNVGDSTRVLHGAYLARTQGPRRAELYWLRNLSGGASFNGKSGYERRHTLGARLAQTPAPGRFDAELEAAWQTGNVGSYDVSAWMVTAVAGRSFLTAGLRVYAALDAASGDSGGAGGQVRTFNQLFPTGHAHLGYVDLHGRQNIIAVSAGVAARPLRGTTVMLDVFDFRRAEANDALYGADGSVVRPAGAGLPARVGREVDLTVRHGWRRLTLQAGASRYFTGPFLEQSGPARDIRWAYAQLTATF